MPTTEHATETRSVRVGRGDGWLAICHDCDWEGRSRRARDTAEADATAHHAAILAGHVLNVAARAENAKGYVLQAEKATPEGADFLHKQAREALRDVLREAATALAALDARPISEGMETR
jgi:hypothetical protein